MSTSARIAPGRGSGDSGPGPYDPGMVGIGVPELAILLLLVVIVVVLVGVTRSRGGPRPPAPPSPRVLSTPIPAELQSRVRELAAQDQRIRAIKELRQATGLGLKEAKDIADAIAAGGVLPVPGGPGRPAARPDLAYRAPDARRCRAGGRGGPAGGRRDRDERPGGERLRARAAALTGSRADAARVGTGPRG